VRSYIILVWSCNLSAWLSNIAIVTRGKVWACVDMIDPCLLKERAKPSQSEVTNRERTGSWSTCIVKAIWGQSFVRNAKARSVFLFEFDSSLNRVITLGM
jgi:hypothetical protein